MGECGVCLAVDRMDGLLDCSEAGSLGHFYIVYLGILSSDEYQKEMSQEDVTV